MPFYAFFNFEHNYAKCHLKDFTVEITVAGHEK